MFNRWRHESREPPSHHLRPERGMHDVKCLQVLLVSETQKHSSEHVGALRNFSLTCMVECCKLPSANSAMDSWMWLSTCENTQSRSRLSPRDPAVESNIAKPGMEKSSD